MNHLSRHMGLPHDDTIKWKHIPRYWPLCGEFTGHRWIPRIKASDAELWCLFFICVWNNSWVNNGDADDLRCRRAHYGVTVMIKPHIILYFVQGAMICSGEICSTTHLSTRHGSSLSAATAVCYYDDIWHTEVRKYLYDGGPCMNHCQACYTPAGRELAGSFG